MPAEQPAVEPHEARVCRLDGGQPGAAWPYLLQCSLYAQFVVLSEAVVKSRGPAYCYHENLRDCVAGEWQVLAAGAADTHVWCVMCDV